MKNGQWPAAISSSACGVSAAMARIISCVCSVHQTKVFVSKLEAIVMYTVVVMSRPEDVNYDSELFSIVFVLCSHRTNERNIIATQLSENTINTHTL